MDSYGRMILRFLVLVLVILLFLIPACSKKSSVELDEESQLPPCAQLKLTRGTQHEKLNRELARIESESGLPTQIDSPRSSIDLDQAKGPTRQSRKKTTAAFVAVLTEQQRVWLMERIEGALPNTAVEVTPENLFAMERLVKSYQEPADELEKLLRRPNFGLYVSVENGTLADLTFIDVATSLSRYLCIRAMVALNYGKLDQALDSILLCSDLLEHLGKLPNTTARMTAANERAFLMRVVQRTANHHLADAATLQNLERLTQAIIQRWPNGKRAMIGERAVGLHTYELVRQGHLASFLTYKEIKKMTEDGTIKSLATYLDKHIDEDEYQYLRHMRLYIEACDLPFHQRKAKFAEASEPENEGDDVYARFSNQFVVSDLIGMQYRLAQDLALCTAMHLTLRTAQGNSTESASVHPVSGKPFALEQTDSFVAITNVTWKADGASVKILKLPRESVRSARRIE